MYHECNQNYVYYHQECIMYDLQTTACSFIHKQPPMSISKDFGEHLLYVMRI